MRSHEDIPVGGVNRVHEAGQILEKLGHQVHQVSHSQRKQQDVDPVP